MATQRILRNVLNVAEKARAARTISFQLNTEFTIKNEQISEGIPIINFPFKTSTIQTNMTFTSIKGRLKGLRYQDPLFHNIYQFKNQELISAKIQSLPVPNTKRIIDNLMTQAKLADLLILWFDGDLEGEAIAKQVEQICLSANQKLEVKRARFNALARHDLMYVFGLFRKAFEELNILDKNKINADKYQKELDFRIRSTINFSNFSHRQIKTLGTGTLPILKLVVDDYLQKKSLKSSGHWQITAVCDKQRHEFKWDNPPILDQNTARAIWKKQLDKDSSPVIFKADSIQKISKKLKKLPLTTSVLLKLATSRLNMTSSEVMNVAENLYTKGFISCPRTQNNKFYSLANLINLPQFIDHPQYSTWVKELIEKGVHLKLCSKINQVPSPIFPSKFVSNHESLAESKLYQLIVEYFLASLSEEAEIQTTTIYIRKDTLKFKLTHTSLIKQGYLAHYRLQSRPQISFGKCPNIHRHSRLELMDTRIHQITKFYPPLTQSLLISKMIERGIGTDNTIHLHIRQLLESGYVTKINGEYEPTQLGLALVSAFKQIGIELCQTEFRARIEANAREIVKGNAQGQIKLKQDLQKFKEIFSQIQKNKVKFENIFCEVLNSEQRILPKTNNFIYSCKNCKGLMTILTSSSSRELICWSCNLSYLIPKKSIHDHYDLDVYVDSGECQVCGWTPLKLYQNCVYTDPISFNVCPNCYNNPQPYMIDQTKQNTTTKLTCLDCKIEECKFHTKRKQSLGLYRCEKCFQGKVFLKKNEAERFALVCDRPNCNNTTLLIDNVKDVESTGIKCLSCSSSICKVFFKGDSPMKVCLCANCSDSLKYYVIEGKNH